MILPVYLYNPTGEDVQVSVTAIDGTAKASDDYEIVKPANGILTFSGDVDSLAIEVEISDKYIGTITKNKKFNIRISSADVSMGAYSDAVITIKDLDHPLDKIGLIDTFVGKVHEDVYGQTLDMSLVITVPEDDDTFEKVLVTGLEPSFASYAVDTPLEGRYDEVNSKLIIKKGQVAMEVPGYSFVLTGTTDGAGKWQNKVGRDVLFIERNLNFLKPGGRMAVVLPQGRFNNSSDKYIREFIAERCRILAVVGLHGNVFKPHTGTKTSVLFVQKWDDDLCPKKDDYPIFFATMQKPSKDNSGDKIYVKNPETGENVLDTHGHLIVEHDLYNHEGLTFDGIAEAFEEFAKKEGLSFFQ